MAATARPKGRQRPAMTISAPVTRNAPTATANPPSGALLVASSAAPGVDHAMDIGIRDFRLSQAAHRPMLIDKAMRPEAACPGVAPIAVRPRMMTAKEEAKPTKAASRPAARASGEKSDRNVFLKSDDSLVRSTDNLNPPPQYSFLTKLLLHTVVRPPDYVDRTVPAPDTNDLILFGKYLATAKFSCYECHSLNMVTNNYNDAERSWGFFRGGNPQVNEDREKIYTPNITGDSVLGIGKWTEAEFSRTVKNGIKPDRKTVKDPMFPYYLLTEKEVHAIYLYLESLK